MKNTEIGQNLSHYFVGPIIKNSLSNNFLHRNPIFLLYTDQSLLTNVIIESLITQNQIKKQLFSANELYRILFIPKKYLNGLDHLASNILTPKSQSEILQLYFQYKLRAGNLKNTVQTTPGVVKKPTFFQRLKKNMGTTLSKVENFIFNNPKLTIIIAIILIVVFLGTTIFSFSGGTTTIPKKPAPNPAPNPAATPSGNPEQKIPPDDGLIITDGQSEHVSAVPKPWDGIGHENYAGKSVPCNDVDESIVEYFKISKETEKLPRILDKALKRILSLDDQTLGEHNILDLFTQKEIEVLFEQTDFLMLPAVKTIIERNEYCVFEVA
jgi:hypothetical protein